MNNSTRTRRYKPFLYLILLVFVSSLNLKAQVNDVGTYQSAGSAEVNQPIVHWVGPEAQCDYSSIQDALADIFDCGIFACPVGRNELRLSANYSHSGQVILNTTVDIRGGYSSCKGSFTGIVTPLSAVNSGLRLFVVAPPGTGSISNHLFHLKMAGVAGGTPLGGVIVMGMGNATLRLVDSEVIEGNAEQGGGIAMRGGGNVLEIVDTEISSNQAINGDFGNGEGGGIYCENGGTINLISGRIRDNVAELSGGGVYLRNQCNLVGIVANEDREILGNRVTDSQFGQGAGIYAISSNIEMGAINSRTIIRDNVVDALPPLHDYDSPGDNRGGGAHLDFSDAVFYNTWFQGNEAADGGAISLAGDSTLLVDRFSGPCHTSDTGNSPDCSLFEYNRARGGLDSDGDEGGDGAVLLASPLLGLMPKASIIRSTIRFNTASCYEQTAPGQVGACDIDNLNAGFSSSSIIRAESVASPVVISGSLFYGNNIGDDDDCSVTFCRKDGFYFAGGPYLMTETTVSENFDADGVFDADLGTTAPPSPEVSIVNSIIADDDPDDIGDFLNVASCNISNFASDMNLQASSIPISNVDLDPQFFNSGSDNFRLKATSPAIDRCDDANGLAVLNYDIIGVPRAQHVGGISNGPGPRDAGAFERKPAGFVKNGTDLMMTLVSDSPNQTGLSEPHDFTAMVSNVGRNSVNLIVFFQFEPAEANVVSLSAPADINGNPVWNCSLVGASCSAVSGLAPGSSKTPITLNVAYSMPGMKSVIAKVFVEGIEIVDVNPDNNTDSGKVFVLDGETVFADSFED